jgi:hypothetical protein
MTGHSRPIHPAALAGYVRSSPKPNITQASAADAMAESHQRFACARLSQSYLPKSRSDFSATFTTIAFDDSSLRWLEINT